MKPRQLFTIRSSNELKLLKAGLALLIKKDYSDDQMLNQMTAIDLYKKLQMAVVKNK
jgi:hypothetical protein